MGAVMSAVRTPRISDRSMEAFENATKRLAQDNPEIAAAARKSGIDAFRQRVLALAFAMVAVILFLVLTAIVLGAVVRLFLFVAGA